MEKNVIYVDYPRQNIKYKEFDKPEEVEKLNNQNLVNRAAETRADSVGEATGSPKETNEIIASIPKIPAKIKKTIYQVRLKMMDI